MSAGPEGRQRADDDGGDRDENDGGDRQPERPDEGLEDDVDGRTRLTQALAEVEVQHVPDVASELHDDGIIEPVQLAELVEHFRRGIDRKEERRRVACQARQEEDQDEQEREREEARYDARSVLGHGFPPR